MGYRLSWEERRRRVGLRACLRAETESLMFLADGGVERE